MGLVHEIAHICVADPISTGGQRGHRHNGFAIQASDEAAGDSGHFIKRAVQLTTEAAWTLRVTAACSADANCFHVALAPAEPSALI